MGGRCDDVANIGDESLREWYERGSFLQAGINLDGSMFYIDKEPEEDSDDRKTYIFIHGFPTSSYDFKGVFDDERLRNDRLVTFDHLGFGFSSKPVDRCYSMNSHAEKVIQLLRHLDLTEEKIIWVAHDMGDSVLTELMSMVWSETTVISSPHIFDRVIFTNGGMYYKLISKRLAQRILINPTLGPIFTRFAPLKLKRAFGREQLASIWGSERRGGAEMHKHIDRIEMLNEFNGGDEILHKLCFYLVERSYMEERWFDTLTLSVMSGLEIKFLWGDDDAVAPSSIVDALTQTITWFEDQGEIVKLKGVGHFLMIEDCDRFVSEILEFDGATQRTSGRCIPKTLVLPAL